MLCASGCVLLSCVSHVAHRAVSVRLWCVPCCESTPPHLPVFQGPSGAAPRLAAYVFILITLICLGPRFLPSETSMPRHLFTCNSICPTYQVPATMLILAAALPQGDVHTPEEIFANWLAKHHVAFHEALTELLAHKEPSLQVGSSLHEMRLLMGQ